ncbi:MAG: DUF4105 domain-containing protein [Oligoflexia bacterium]|nr:DUF4105 domain-containing protein [Oligoflexia bacterium]
MLYLSKAVNSVFLATLIGLSTLLGATPSDASTPFSLTLAPDTIQPSERAGLEKFLADATAKLPPHLKEVLARNITVRFSTDLDRTTLFVIPTCGPTPVAMTHEHGGNSTLQIRGQVSAGWLQKQSDIHEIVLNAAMKDEILKGPNHSTPYGCGHHTLYGLAMATLLHEVSHLYDFSEEITPERARQLQNCAQLVKEKSTTDAEAKSECTRELAVARVVSHTPSFQSMVDWDNKTQERLNFSALRSPDPYEYSALEEEFAVNMEYFLLDPEYACRRPVEFEYLRDHFGFDPFPKRPCSMPTQVQLANDALGQSGGDIVDIDPSRVYQIQFLFASQGPQLMSRWGHAMYRIIVCNKKRTEVGPACLNDLSDHVVVSFIANVGGWSINAWDGLTGKYPSQMFLYHFYPDIVNEYTVDQFRSLVSLPLKLTDAEKNRFVERVLEQHWQYTGKYYFFSNNCATEALHFLKGVVRDSPIQQWGVLTPLGLYDQLSGTGFVDKALLSSTDESQKVGYSFPSEENVYESAFERIKQISPENVPMQNFQDYAAHTDAAERLALYNKLVALDPKDAKPLADRFFILETYIYRATGKAFMAAVVGQLETTSAGMNDKVSRMMELGNANLPWNHVMGGYGIPLPADAPTSTTTAAQEDAQNAEVKALYAQVMAWAKQNLAQAANELDAIQANEKVFLTASL